MLRCDRPWRILRYSQSTEDWVAFPGYLFDIKEVQCGDLVRVIEYLPDGTTRSRMARAWDSGSFGNHTKLIGLPIVVDMPPWVATWGLYPGFARVKVTNLSAVARQCVAMGLCDLPR